MTYLRNTWYAAAWANEVKADALLARTFLSEAVVMFREADGAPVALRDRCPHRYAPLHLGQVREGVVQCGYHGLQFNGSGACVLNPHGEGHIPLNAQVQPYPMAERHDMIWIWMGEPGEADPSLVPDLSSVINDQNKTVRHYLTPQADYQLMVDNLLDLGHTAYLHPDSLGSEAIIHSTRTTNVVDGKVVDELWAPDGEAPPLAQFLYPKFRGQQVDHWLASTWQAPSVIVGFAGYAPAGADRAGAEGLPGFHLLTPETDGSCHYFAALGRNFRTEEVELDALIDMAVTKAFSLEDMPMVASIQGALDRASASMENLKPVVLATDTAGLMARKVLRRRMQAEAEARPDPSLDPAATRPTAGTSVERTPEHA